MKLRQQTHIECIYVCKWIAVGSSIAFIAAFSLKIIIKWQKDQKFFLTRFYMCVSWIRPTTRVGENRAFASSPKFSGIILDFIKMWCWSLILVKAPEQTIDYMYCKLSSLFLHVSAYSQQQLWIGCNLYSLRVKIAYLDIESKLANHRFVNILVFKDVWWYRTWRWREVGDSSQSFSSDTLQGISSEWSGDTTELVYIQKRRDLIG